MTTTTIKQGMVRIPILRTLDGAGGTARGSDVIAHVLTELGGSVSVKEHYNAANNAKFDLKQRGCIADAGHGLWSLTGTGRAVLAGADLPPIVRETRGTPVGEVLKPVATGEVLTEVRKPRAAKASTGEVLTEVRPAPVEAAPAPVEAPVEAVPVPVEEAPVEAAPAAPKRRLKVAAAAPAPVEVPEWLHDDAIRGAVIESSECFGAWSAKSSECGKCALAGWCRNSKASTLVLLASKLTTETPASPAPVAAPVAKLDAAVSTANAPEANREAPKESGTMRAPFDGLCAETGRPIKKGDAVRYVRGKGLVLLTT